MKELFAELRDWLLDALTAHHSPIMSAITDLAASISTLNDTATSLTTAVNTLVAQVQSQAGSIPESQLTPLNDALTSVNASLTTLVGVINSAVTPAA